MTVPHSRNKHAAAQRLSSLRLEISAHLIPLLPESLQSRISGPSKTWNLRDLKQVAKPKDAPVRLIIGPANYAGQGYFWARAAETIPGVSAANLQRYDPLRGYTFRANASVKNNVWAYSHIWRRRQSHALYNATHVVIEAASPLLSDASSPGWKLTVNQVRDLQRAGVKVALLWHGTDIRLPTKHQELEPFSPYETAEAAANSRMESVVRENLALADELDVPEFVSNPYLKAFRPGAKWLPTLSDPSKWDLPAPPHREVPLVLHAPSSGPMKGSDSIRQAMARLEKRGVIEYKELSGVPSEEMPAHVAQADIVIDGIRNGQYGVASLEAMLARRVAVAHVWDSVRSEMRNVSGMELPVVEATPETIGAVIESLAADPSRRRELGERGRGYVLKTHSEEAAAESLREFLAS